MKKGFVISWYYPPGNSSEGLVTFKLLKNSRYQYDVWTRADQQQSVWDRKSDESKLTAKNIKIIQGKCDNIKEWVDGGLKYFIEHKDEYDFIMSRSMPVESHEIAIKIKKMFPEIKWIASFGDPIVNTPYIDAITMGNQRNPYNLREYFAREDLSVIGASRVLVSPVRNMRKFLWKKDKKSGNKVAKHFEDVNKYVVNNADILIYNNPYQLDHAFLDKDLKKNKNKSRVLEHSFDPSLYPVEKDKKDNNKITFIYVGHLDDTRNARSLLKAIKHIKEKDPSLEKKVEFIFYGHLSDGDKVFILDNNLVDVVKVKKDIKYLESLKVIKDADWAILIDANFTSLVDDCIYLPAKLVDYIGARTNVLSISHVRGAGSDIINEIGGGKVVTHSPDDIYLYLSKIIYQGYKPMPYNEKGAKRFESSVMSKKLDEIIKDLLEEK